MEVRLDAGDLRLPGRYRRARANVPESPEDFEIYYRHRFSLGTSSQTLLSDFKVVEDEFELTDLQGRPLLRVWRGADNKIKLTVQRRRLRSLPWLSAMLDPYPDLEFAKFLGRSILSSTNLVTDQQFGFSPLLLYIRSQLSDLRVFQLSPYQCRTPGVSTPNAMLERYGENLPGAADNLRRNNERAWTKVQSAMRSILPDLLAIEVVYTEDRRLALQFRERGVGRPWNTGEISDGTIQALALFVALFDDRAQLLVIEEPENSVHPWILRQFVDLCRDTTKQVILTTHSPVLLNYVAPSTVRLMSASEGRSRIQQLIGIDDTISDLVYDGDLSLFEAYDSGIVTSAVPRGLAPEVSQDLTS